MPESTVSPKYTAVLFDMYRTLGEDRGEHHFIDTLLEYDLTPDDAKYVMAVADNDAFDGQEHYEHSEDRDTYDAWRRQHLVKAIERTGATTEVANEICDKHDVWQSDFVGRIGAYDETHDVLSQLRSLGLQVLVCSNWNWDADLVIRDLGIEDVVDEVFASARLGVRKPHHAFFETILKRRSLFVDEALFVGDMWETDIVGATSVGMQAIWVDRWNRTAPNDLPNVTRVENLYGVVDAVNK